MGEPEQSGSEDGQGPAELSACCSLITTAAAFPFAYFVAFRLSLISFMAALSQAQAEATKEAQRAGIEHAKARDDAYRGRKPSFTREQLGQVRDMLTTGTSISTIAKTTGLSRQAIYRLKDNPAWAEGVLATWAAA
jgi:putative DNA-invertase from lambdoid prophage Rac